MSHKATNWAFQQVDISNSEWRVLAVLADCHNPEHGCFPSQEYILERMGWNDEKDKGNMSRSSLNVQLNSLEDRGLIKREIRVNKRTKRQESTIYILGCDANLGIDVDSRVQKLDMGAVSRKTPKPCPETGH
jgi:hypothetical protein